MVTKEEAKIEIQKIIKEFEDNKAYFLKTDEANIETKLIEPLFEALGWTKHDFEKREKIQRENKRGIPDYAFKIDGRTVFFLEAKKVSVDIDKNKETWKQAISYALSKRVQFAVLMNFEGLKIFCVEQENALNNQFRDLKYTEYIARFDDLWLLSKESFENNHILDIAVREQRLKKRKTIDSELLEDLMHIRKLLADNIEKNHSHKYISGEKDEIIQRILDRLIFIRKAEDIGINRSNIVLKELSGFPDNRIYSELKRVFKLYDEDYNSGLFLQGKDNDCDVINLDGKVVRELLELLYESRNKDYIYDFEWIDADVLGQVYEQYLGIILSQSKKGVSKLKEGQAHRREQGIYYTPTYIVDYIVKNTVGELLKGKNVKPEKIRVLDLACGSGSFLTKTFDILNNYYIANSKDYSQTTFDKSGIAFSTKEKIIKNSIFGVDLDNKAVEIAQLNLLLKIAEKGHKLPLLQGNIKSGNSLIDDDKTAEYKALKWEREFKEIMADGKFDVVIGNPPYIDYREIQGNEFIKKHYFSATGKDKYNILVLFIEKGLELLRDGGLLGFIVSNQFLCSDFGQKIREYILKNAKIKQIIDVSMVKVFRDASTYPIIIILEKTNPKNNTIKTAKVKDENDFIKNKMNFIEIKQDIYQNFDKNLFLLDLTTNNINIINKMRKDSTILKDCVEDITWGTSASGYGKKKIKKSEFLSFSRIRQQDYIKIIQTSDIQKYRINWQEEYIPKDIYTKNKLALFEKNKIVIGRLNKFLKATIDNEKHALGKATLITLKKNTNPKLLLAILNSKLIDYYFKLLFVSTHMSQGYIRYDIPYLEQLPIKKISDSYQQPIIKTVDKLLSLNEQLNEIGDKKTDRRASIEREIDESNKELDTLIYKIYGITKEEQSTIEKV